MRNEFLLCLLAFVSLRILWALHIQEPEPLQARLCGLSE